MAWLKFNNRQCEAHRVDDFFSPRRNGSTSSDERPSLGEHWAVYLAKVAILAAVYFGAAKLGLTMAFVAEQVTAVWPPTGIALAALLSFGQRVWPGVTLGAFLANATANEPLAVAAGIATGNTLEAVIGAWLLRRVGFNNSLERVRDVLGLATLAAGLSTMVSATIGATSLCLGSVAPWTAFFSIWSVWWLGDAMGDLLVAPLLLTCVGWHCMSWRPQRVAEGAVLLFALAAVSLFVFVQPSAAFSPDSLAYTIFPFVIWAGLRFGPPGAALATFLAAAIAIWGTVHGWGPFTTSTTHESLIRLQTFMGVVAAAALVLAAVTTERVRAQQAAQQSQDELDLALEAARVGVWKWDQATGRVLWSDNLEAIHGLPPGMFAGTFDAFVESIFPEDREMVLQKIRGALEQGRPYEIEYRSIGADGTLRWLEGRGRVIHDDQGRPVRMLGVCADISQRKRLEGRFRATVESTPTAMVMIDAAGKIVLVNHETERLFGYGRDELYGQLVETLVPERFRAQHPRLREGFLANPTARRMGLAGGELFAQRKNGSEFPVEIGLNPMHTEEGLFVLAAIVDVTERKRAEDEIRRLNAELERRVAQRTAQLEAANQELEAFSYSVSHDLRAPLRRIQGFNRILLEQCADQLDDVGKDCLGRIAAATGRLDQIIQDLLRLALTTRSELRLETVDLTAIAYTVAAELRQREPQRQVKLVIAPDITATGDAHLLRIVLENLMGNAWKFTSGQQSSRIEFGKALLDGETTYFVRDNGAGFDMAFANRLFNPFQRLHSEDEFPGVGIGLATVQRIVRRHGGRVWAEGAVNKGATFYFTLPTP